MWPVAPLDMESPLASPGCSTMSWRILRLVEDLRRAGVPDDVVDAVSTVTRRPKETYDQFIDRVVQHGGLALQVKHADLQSNLGRLEGISDYATRRRLQAKYEPALAKVEAALDLTEQQSE